MKVEYEAKVPEHIIEHLRHTIEYVKEREVLKGQERMRVIDRLLSLLYGLEEPISGTIEVEPEDVEREPYPIWEDMD